MNRKQVIKNKHLMNYLYGYKRSTWIRYCKRWRTLTRVWDSSWKKRARGYHNKILT